MIDAGFVGVYHVFPVLIYGCAILEVQGYFRLQEHTSSLVGSGIWAIAP